MHCNANSQVLSFFATFLSFSRRPLLLLPPAPPPVPASSRARCPSPFVTADPTGTARCVNALAPARWPFALLRVAIFRFSSFPHDASRMAPLDVPTRWQVPGAKRTAACVAALVSCSCTMHIGDLCACGTAGMAKSASEHGRSRMGDMSAWSASHHDEAIMTSRRASTFRARHSQFLPSIHVQPHCAPWCGWRWRRVARDCRLVCGC